MFGRIRVISVLVTGVVSVSAALSLVRLSLHALFLVTRSSCVRFVDPQPGQDLLEAGQDDCRIPQRTLDKAYLKLKPSDISQAERES